MRENADEKNSQYGDFFLTERIRNEINKMCVSTDTSYKAELYRLIYNFNEVPPDTPW